MNSSQRSAIFYWNIAFIDGIYYSGSLADYDVDTVERFEVVKGPQSALYGRNTYSGAINLISKAPGDTWTGRVQVDLAEDDRYEATANVRGPLADGLGIALGGRILDNAGAFRNAFDGTRIGKQQSYSGFGLLQFNNGGPFRASLRANYNVLDDGQPEQGRQQQPAGGDGGLPAGQLPHHPGPDRTGQAHRQVEEAAEGAAAELAGQPHQRPDRLHPGQERHIAHLQRAGHRADAGRPGEARRGGNRPPGTGTGRLRRLCHPRPFPCRFGPGRKG